MKKTGIILIGGGGHCKACIDVIEMENRLEIIGILDVSDKIGTKVLGYPIIGTDLDIERLAGETEHFFLTLGQITSAEKRISLYNQLKRLDLKIPTIISPLAYVSHYAHVGEGTIVMHHSMINAAATIGVNCIINSRALIEHDAEIGDHCHVATGAIINGGVKLGEKSFFGSGAVSRQNIVILPNSFIKANSLVK
jgi:sugar O-acyltransferase (sialic acid O-acetyltransferase NeuD family)